MNHEATLAASNLQKSRESFQKRGFCIQISTILAAELELGVPSLLRAELFEDLVVALEHGTWVFEKTCCYAGVVQDLLAD